MSQENSEFLNRVRLAQDKLTNQFLQHPDVSLIDIGRASKPGQTDTEVVLRIHVREPWIKAKSEDRTVFPKHVDGIPVRVMFGDYQLQTDTSASNQE